jgi:hypothetical protein
MQDIALLVGRVGCLLGKVLSSLSCKFPGQWVNPKAKSIIKPIDRSSLLKSFPELDFELVKQRL